MYVEVNVYVTQKQVMGGRSSCDRDTIHPIKIHCAIKMILKLLNVTLSKWWKEREDRFMLILCH